MSLQSWNGARWWKCDLHTHTPASTDYGKGPNQEEEQQCTPRDWLLGYMRAGVDCVAVTDHNGGGWIDRLKADLEKLVLARPAGFRPLYLFPGVEIAVHGNVHLLAIFSREKTRSDIIGLLGAVGVVEGTSTQTREPFRKVVKQIVNSGGIAIPAHADCEKGLLTEASGDTLKEALRCDQVFATEIRCPQSEKPQLYRDMKVGWTEIVGSDSHHCSGKEGQRYPGSHFTWVKMGDPPDIEGLRLALLDGSLSVRRSDTHPTSPNEQHAEAVLESIEVTGTKYMGQGSPFKVDLNPWLNAIIGGRGTGKSSLVEFLRIALRRDGELPEELRKEFAMYSNEPPDGNGLLTERTKFRVIYLKNGARFRVQWDPKGALDAIEEETANGVWSQAPGKVVQRFPVRIYSQKQIFHAATTPGELLRIVDEASDGDQQPLKSRWSREEHNILSIRVKVRQIGAELQDENKLKGELDDVKRKLAVFERSGHADILRAYQQNRRQQREIRMWEEQWVDAGKRIRTTAADIVPDALDEANTFGGSQADLQLLTQAHRARDRLGAIRKQLEQVADEADETVTRWKKELEKSAWKKAANEAVAAYESLSKQLAEEGISDPSDYGLLVQRRQLIEQDLDRLKSRKTEVVKLKCQADDSRRELLNIRRERTRIRRRFLEGVLQGNPYVRMHIVPYGEQKTVEADFRRLIQKEDDTFRGDIDRLLQALKQAQENQSGSAAVETAITGITEKVRRIREGTCSPVDRRFANHLGNLQPEVFDRLDMWFPEDHLKVEYSPTGDGRHLRPISAGSPGQKTAALLAFLLSYGKQPLVLDQPEDDLDNRLVHELIVNQIRKEKQRRQIIVVTHNPNIVVNGDAELVVALAAKDNDTKIESEGSLLKKGVRASICTLMEGGLDAFKERYRRIVAGVSDD